MSFSSEVKEEISKLSNLANKEAVKFELLGYLSSNNITIEKTYWLPQLKPIWNNLYEANASLSIFQSYEFMLNFWKNSWIYCLTHKEFPVFYLK